MNSHTRDNPCPTCTLPCDAKLIDGEAGCVTTPDENRFVAEDGTVHEAVEGVCAKDCAMWGFDRVCRMPLDKRCDSFGRKDHRNIVWKREAGK